MRVNTFSAKLPIIFVILTVSCNLNKTTWEETIEEVDRSMREKKDFMS
jgi:hypothetical protein